VGGKRVPMRVLLVSNIFPNSIERERGIFTYQIALALNKRCHVEVVAPLPWVPTLLRKRNRGKYAYAKVPIQEEIGGLVVHHPRYGVIPKVMGFIHPMFMFIPLSKLIKKLDRENRIDLINAHWVFPDGISAAWVARKLGKPVALTALGCDINHYPTLLFRKGLIQMAMGTADVVTVKGNSLKNTALELQVPEKKIFVIPNGIDSQRFRIMERIEVRRRLGIQGKGPFLLTVGSLDDVKGNRYLLEALNRMAGDGENLPRLFIVGDGPLRGALVAQAQRYGIANRVTFLGKRPHHEIPLWMNAADLFCLPSIREGRPNVLLEALACGTPAVASDVGSVSEIIQERNGRMALPGDPESFRLQILACLNRRWERDAIRKTVGGYTWDECAAGYLTVFQQALQKHTDHGGQYQCAE
jgi:teichuronic acid biosynthesis glycosyltransferase TuaC